MAQISMTVNGKVRKGDVEPRHASADVRRAMIPVFTRRALTSALARA